MWFTLKVLYLQFTRYITVLRHCFKQNKKQIWDVTLIRIQKRNLKVYNSAGKSTEVLISPQPDLLPDVFCFMVRIFRFMLVLFYIYKQY